MCRTARFSVLHIRGRIPELLEVKVPRYAPRHRAPGRHKAKRHPLVGSGPWRKTFAAVTGASLGVTGVVAGGAFLTSGLHDPGNEQRVLANPQTGAALGARAMDLTERRADADRADRSTRTGSSDEASAVNSATPKASAEPDELLTATSNGVIDRTAIEERREAEAEREALESSDPRVIAQAMVSQRGWGSGEFDCLDALWMKESGWSASASNPSSGAYGIPQALPGTKMATFGDDWEWNPRTQIEWGLWYIDSTYGTPCGAWAHSQDVGWY